MSGEHAQDPSKKAMSVYETILDLIKHLTEEGVVREDIQIYMAKDAFGWLRESLFPDDESTWRHVSKDNVMEESSWTGHDQGDYAPDYTTAQVVRAMGVSIFESPDMKPGRVVALDSSSITRPADDLRQITTAPIIIDPSHIESFNVRFEESDKECAKCGKSANSDDWAMVEGDDGEMYCSLKCLNEVYVS